MSQRFDLTLRTNCFPLFVRDVFVRNYLDALAEVQLCPLCVPARGVFL